MSQNDVWEGKWMGWPRVRVERLSKGVRIELRSE